MSRIMRAEFIMVVSLKLACGIFKFMLTFASKTSNVHYWLGQTYLRGEKICMLNIKIAILVGLNKRHELSRTEI